MERPASLNHRRRNRQLAEVVRDSPESTRRYAGFETLPKGPARPKLALTAVP